MAINFNPKYGEQLRWMWIFGMYDTLHLMQPDTDGLGCEHPDQATWQLHVDIMVLKCQRNPNWKSRRQ